MRNSNDNPLNEDLLQKDGHMSDTSTRPQWHRYGISALFQGFLFLHNNDRATAETPTNNAVQERLSATLGLEVVVHEVSSVCFTDICVFFTRHHPLTSAWVGYQQAAQFTVAQDLPVNLPAHFSSHWTSSLHLLPQQ